VARSAKNLWRFTKNLRHVLYKGKIFFTAATWREQGFRRGSQRKSTGKGFNNEENE